MWQEREEQRNQERHQEFGRLYRRDQSDIAEITDQQPLGRTKLHSLVRIARLSISASHRLGEPGASLHLCNGNGSQSALWSDESHVRRLLNHVLDGRNRTILTGQSIVGVDSEDTHET